MPEGPEEPRDILLVDPSAGREDTGKKSRERRPRVDLNREGLFAPLGEEMDQYYRWLRANPPPKIPDEIVFQGAGTETQMPFIHLATCAPTYVVAGRYLRELEAGLGRPPRLLEIGCGTGIGAYYLKTRLAPEASITAIDFSGEAISYAQESYGKSGIRYAVAKAQDLRFRNEQPDIVLAVQVLEHIPEEDAPQFIEDIGVVLGRWGVALVSTPNRELCQDLYDHSPTDDPSRRLIPSHEHEYYEDELKALFEEAGEGKGQLFTEVQVNSQVNLVNRKLWTVGVKRLRLLKGVSGALRRRVRASCVSEKLAKKSWEAIMKILGISYRDLALANEYHRGRKDVGVDSFLVVAEK